MNTASVVQQTTAQVDHAHAVHLLRQMLRIRRFEEKAAELYSATKIRGFPHLYIGEEAVAVGVTEALGLEDAVVATYREHGHALTRGVSSGASRRKCRVQSCNESAVTKQTLCRIMRHPVT
jgi:TPP-dependent pyruvate/acetoin dehydrogenase alpha subunit